MSLWACSVSSESPTFSQRGESIIGGFRANDPFWNHTGALVVHQEGIDSVTALCSATLIASETAVTAKHCMEVVSQLAGLAGVHLAWAEGPDAEAPSELIRVVALEQSPVDDGGFLGRGQDVAVVHLDSPSLAPPATVSLFEPEQNGDRMISIGYGVHGASGASDLRRRMGRETIAAVEGSFYDAMFGNFEGYVEWLFTGSVTDLNIFDDLEDPEDPSLLEAFNGASLLTGHEVVTGLAPGDTQTCNGDSGGPLGRLSRDGTFRTYGVVSGGFGSSRMQCDFGTVFAVFGPEAFEFLQEAEQWQDPCGDLTEEGVCNGSRVERCETDLPASIRTLSTEDCADTGRECVSTSLGAQCQVVDEPVQEAGVDFTPDSAPEHVSRIVANELRRLKATFYREPADDARWRD